ncbi:lasso peptide isopeptide bond-forming cyclase [Phosphitispora fastidiosa]|uniref:lasso peptide isopeptide bond-forming cyclase n=1 Tax=Phosphitispora fastidiosa TaxID=2837202 RepID=UPI001E40F12F|nr:lasso peptide isopeptide bond-forming cyclase [Phosphitispora fastidiosa]MBU7007231.1 asparagine synthase (glutamine-hydrolyzing) [Phosphitispora fastidiosa]
MSAIAGIFHLNDEPITIDHGLKMMQALQQYPADDVQVWHQHNIFLGCHAQWITPESVGERLPYYDSTRQLAITADAIIDNRYDLFEALQVEPALRKEMPDSELILLAYQKWGQDAPKHLIGDFAFMIWDGKKRLLFGARDFSGTRTLYFYRSHQRFAFCTIMEPLFSLPYVAKEINEQWLAEFLAMPDMYETIDPSSSVFKNIEQIPPAHTISVSGSTIRFSRYVTLAGGEKLNLKSNQEYEEAFCEVFQNAVTARIRTHRPVGAHLSGGLDSGSAAAFAARALQMENKQLHTFSYIPVSDFTDWTPKHRLADERPFMQSVVRHAGNIQANYLDFAGKSPLSEIDAMLEMLEMPYKFPENSYWIKGIYEAARQEGIGVLLDGARGNLTISWGPALEYYTRLLKRLHWFRLYREINEYSKNIGLKKSRVMSALRKKLLLSVKQGLRSRGQGNFPIYISPELAKRTKVFEKLQEHGISPDGFSRQNAYETRETHFRQLYSWMVNGTLGSKASLHYSLWERDPTNDIRVVSFCLSVPKEQLVQNGLDRALIRRAAKNILPDKVRLNQRVRGFQSADGVHRMAGSWDVFISELQQMAADRTAAELFDTAVINNAISGIREPKPEYIVDFNFKILMRSLVVYRFVKKMSGKEVVI